MNERAPDGAPLDSFGKTPRDETTHIDPTDLRTRTIGPARDPSDQNTTIEPAGGLPGLPELSVAIGNPDGSSHAATDAPKLDGYQVLCAIGEGGMGTVWRAVQLSTRRNVALKLMNAGGFGSERARQRFDREVEITAKLEHPNIARIYDSGLNRGVYFYAMELIDGLPLDQHVTHNHLDRAAILRLFAIVCRGVDHAHARGVIHRDLKPGNILVSRDGVPHVLDFGLAKALQQAGKEAGISLDGEVAGTPGYMSPEQAMGKLDVDARCDVYSLGVILYRLLTGTSPHDLSGSYLDIIRRVSEEEPTRPRLADRTMDRELEALLLRAIQREPSHRYKTAGELARDIENFLAGNPIAAKPPTTIYFLRKRVVKHRVKIFTVVTVIALISVAAALTHRLIRSHRNNLVVAAEKDDQRTRALEEQRKGALANAQNAILGGDTAMAKNQWNEARVAYSSAIPDLVNSGSSLLPADLALWDLARTAPAPLTTFALPPASSNAPAKTSISCSPVIFQNGWQALVGYADGSVRVVDLPMGRTIQVIDAHQQAVRSVGISADGSLAITGSDDGSVKLWDIKTGQRKAELRDVAAPLKNWVTHVALSPDNCLALAVSGTNAQTMLSARTYDDTVTIWDLSSGKRLITTDHAAQTMDVKRTVTHAEFSPDSSKIVTASAEITVWNIKDGKLAAVVPDSGMTAAFSEDGRTVAAGSSAGTIFLLNIASGKSAIVRKEGSAVIAVRFDHAGRQIIAATEEGEFSAINLDGTVAWKQPPRGDITYCALSPDATVGMTSADDGLSVWCLAGPTGSRDLATRGPFPSVMVSADGRLALARSSRRGTSFGAAGGAILFDSGTGKRLLPAQFPTERCDGLAFSRDGRSIAHLAGNVLAVWSLDPPHEVHQFTLTGKVTPADRGVVAISPDGTKVAIGCGDDSLAIYSLLNGEVPLKLTGHAGPITAAVFSADGRQILTASEDRSARLWDANSGARVVTLTGHAASINAVSLSDDGKFAVTAAGQPTNSGGNDNSVRLWELPTGKPLLTLPTAGGPVRSVSISGNGRLIAAGDDRAVTLYDRATGDLLRSVPAVHGPVSSLAFDWDGSTLLCGSETLSLWNLGLAAKQRDFEATVPRARLHDANASLTPSELLSLGLLNRARGMPMWAMRFFDQARAAGAVVPAIQSMQCNWLAGRFSAAASDLKTVSATEAPPFYVRLCQEALAPGK